MFWLSSRYYSPELCRFISPDSIDYLDPESINGLNLYAYCNNNPIMYADPSGHIALWALALIGIAVSGLITGALNVMTMSENESALGAFADGFFEGSVSAASLAIGLAIGAYTGGAGFAILGGIVAIGGGFVGGKYGNAISQQISYGNVDWTIANINGGFAALTNLVAYIGLYMNKDILSTSGNFLTRFLENVGPSSVGFGISVYLGTLPKPSLNDYRNEERIKSQKGKFIWDYWI